MNFIMFLCSVVINKKLIKIIILKFISNIYFSSSSIKDDKNNKTQFHTENLMKINVSTFSQAENMIFNLTAIRKVSKAVKSSKKLKKKDKSFKKITFDFNILSAASSK